MEINNQLIKHYLRNVMFLNGTSYAGKSTMAKLLANRYDLILCGENYDCIPEGILTPEKYPNLSYFDTMSGWQEFLNRTPEEYERWIKEDSKELVEFEVSYLMNLGDSKKVIVDTNIPTDILHEISDYSRVAIMLSPQSLSVDKFFDRDDPDKVFLYEKIYESENPEKTKEAFLASMARINGKENYDAFMNSGFFLVIRENADDTKEETLMTLAKHFGLA